MPDRKGPVLAVLAAGAGHFFLLFPIQPHPSLSISLVGMNLPPFETFKSNMTKNPSNVTSIVMLVHSFRAAAQRDLTLGHIRVIFFDLVGWLFWV